MVAGGLLDKDDVASLGAALRYVAIVLAAVPALGAVLRVRTSQADLVDSPASQRAMVVNWVRKTALPAGLLVGGAMLLAPYVIPLIDSGRYPASIEVFQILLLTAFAAYVLAPAANMLMAQRKYTSLAAIFIVALVANLAGDIAVARTFGVVGIAVVSTCVYVTVEVTMFFLAISYASRKISSQVGVRPADR
jgi:O-antigen/teichoic acid export membrane protein